MPESVPFMITAAMKLKLSSIGYTPEQIRNMTPAEAHKIIPQPVSSPKEQDELKVEEKGQLSIGPFDPNGEFYDNIRDPSEIVNDDLTELRESMLNLGWFKELPALVDENNVVLIGHRRMRVATELGINPVTDIISLGIGDEADAKRLALAISSNIGRRELSPKSRQRIAYYLYNEREWSMEAVAKALNISQPTVSRDIAKEKDIIHLNNVKKQKQNQAYRRDTLGRKASPGRPRKEQKKRSSPSVPKEEIIEKFGDGEWHPLPVIAEDLGIEQDVAKRRLNQIGKSDNDIKVRSKQVGKDLYYRIFTKEIAWISYIEAENDLQPIINSLKLEGNKGHSIYYEPKNVLVQAHRIERLLDEWAEKHNKG